MAATALSPVLVIVVATTSVVVVAVVYSEEATVVGEDVVEVVMLGIGVVHTHIVDAESVDTSVARLDVGHQY